MPVDHFDIGSKTVSWPAGSPGNMKHRGKGYSRGRHRPPENARAHSATQFLGAVLPGKMAACSQSIQRGHQGTRHQQSQGDPIHVLYDRLACA